MQRHGYGYSDGAESRNTDHRKSRASPMLRAADRYAYILVVKALLVAIFLSEGRADTIQEWEIGGKTLPKPSISRTNTLRQSKNRKKAPKCHKIDRLTLQPSFKLVTERALTADEEATWLGEGKLRSLALSTGSGLHHPVFFSGHSNFPEGEPTFLNDICNCAIYVSNPECIASNCFSFCSKGRTSSFRILSRSRSSPSASQLSGASSS